MAAAASLLLLPLLFTISQLLPPASCSFHPASSKSNRCDWCPRHTAAAVANLNGGSGACGYGDDTNATDLLNGAPHVAAAGADFFRCGACYQLRCRDRRVCGDAGVKVVVADAANRTAGFRLPREAFAAMARRGMADQLAGLGSVHVDFRRIPCEYEKNLAVRVEEGSRNPGHLAIRFLYQGGQTEIAAVEVAQTAASHPSIEPSSWQHMERVVRRRSSRHGNGNSSGMVAWRTPRAPAGPLRLRLVVTAGFGGKWLRTEEAVLPADWRSGQTYDTGLRVTDVALSTCARSCRARPAGGDDDDEELR